MTGPLLHIMPIMKPHRLIDGDPYFNYVSFLSEWHGRPEGNTAAALDSMNIPQDQSTNNLPLFISGTPRRFPLAEDLLSPATRGVSDVAAYQFDENKALGSAIVVGDCGPIALLDNEFDIYVKFRTPLLNTYGISYIAGRWKLGGGCSWVLEYYPALTRLRLRISVDGTTNNSTWGICEFRLGSTNDGVTLAELQDNTWHEIHVIRTGDAIVLYLDGHAGSRSILMTNLFTTQIFEPGSDTSLLNIGSLPADLTGIRTSGGAFPGQIKEFKMTIAGHVELDVNFNEYWSMWWVGNYPQTNHPNAINVGAEAFQNNAGLKKSLGYVGNTWPYDDSIDFVGSDFTIELFDFHGVFIDKKIQTVVGMGWSSYKCWRLLIKNSGAYGTPGHLIFQYTTDNIVVNTVEIQTGLTDGQIINSNISICRTGGVLNIYMDGTRVVSTTISGSLYSGATASVPLGFYASLSKIDTADEVTKVLAIRLTKGIGRYRGPFYRVPMLPLPKYAA